MSILERAPRTSAVAIGLALVAALELVCRLAGVGDHRDRPDPFAGFSRLQPTFALETPVPGKPAFFSAEGDSSETRRFLARKPDDGFRVFVFGGSTEAGTPYGYDYSFAEFLRRQLASALPGRHVEVVNCAAPGYASRRLLYLAQEVAGYEPDLFVVSTGHNELIEQRLYAHLFDEPAWVFALRQRLRTLRLYVLLEDLLHAVRGGDERAEIDGEKLYVPVAGPLATKYWQDRERDPAHQLVLARAMLDSNLERMVRAGRDAGAEVLLLSQSKNYADWPVVGDPADPIAAQAIAHFARAEGLRAEERWGEAREAYRLAQNTFNASFGTTPGRNETVREVARRTDSLWLDVEPIFEAHSPNGLVGFDLFVDFLHPNLAGHQLLARSVFETLRDAGVPVEGWRDPEPLPSPESMLADAPQLRGQELRIRVIAEVTNQRLDVAREVLEQLRAVAPDDPELPRLERWISGDLPFDFGMLYEREPEPVQRSEP